MQPNRVHVAFDDQKAFEVGAAAPRLKKRIQLVSLVEEHGLRRVQVLRLPLIEDASPKRNDPTSGIADGKHDPVSEAVVMPISVPILTPFALNDEPEVRERTPRLLGAAEAPQNVIPRVGC